jgi:hypothetical protein
MGGAEMTENFDVQALFDEYVNVETTVYYWDNTPNVTLSSLRSAAQYLKGHPGPAELHVHIPGDRVIDDRDQLKAIVDAV